MSRRPMARRSARKRGSGSNSTVPAPIPNANEPLQRSVPASRRMRNEAVPPNMSDASKPRRLDSRTEFVCELLVKPVRRLNVRLTESLRFGTIRHRYSGSAPAASSTEASKPARRTSRKKVVATCFIWPHLAAPDGEHTSPGAAVTRIRNRAVEGSLFFRGCGALVERELKSGHRAPLLAVGRAFDAEVAHLSRHAGRQTALGEFVVGDAGSQPQIHWAGQAAAGNLDPQAKVQLVFRQRIRAIERQLDSFMRLDYPLSLDLVHFRANDGHPGFERDVRRADSRLGRYRAAYSTRRGTILEQLHSKLHAAHFQYVHGHAIELAEPEIHHGIIGFLDVEKRGAAHPQHDCRDVQNVLVAIHPHPRWRCFKSVLKVSERFFQRLIFGSQLDLFEDRVGKLPFRLIQQRLPQLFGVVFGELGLARILQGEAAQDLFQRRLHGRVGHGFVEQVLRIHDLGPRQIECENYGLGEYVAYAGVRSCGVSHGYFLPSRGVFPR